MSIAWGSLVLLVLLLPGVLFFVGLYLPERFTRETTERSALGQLAAVLLVALLVHGSLYLFQDFWCEERLPCVDLRGVLTALTLEAGPEAIPAVASNIHRHRWWIFAYLMFTSAAGIAAGFATGSLVVRGKLRGLTQHGWVYDLTVADNLTVAYVVTHIREANRVLMYQGFLRGFALQRDGRFSYVVLTDVLRGYLHLGDRPVTSSHDELCPIGASGLAIRSHAGQKARYSRRERSYFVIEGEDVANAVFDRLEFDLRAASPTEFQKIVERERQKLANEGALSGTDEPRPST